MRHIVETGLADANWFILAYFVLINTSYLILIILAAQEFARHLRRLPFAGYEDATANPLTLPISVIAPAYNESITIVESTRGMLALRYPNFEVVVVDDGSTDDTFEQLRQAFDLVEVPRVVPQDVPTKVRVRSIHVPRGGGPLVVARKDNSGRSDALNVGINVATNPLVCFIDADSILDPEALLSVSKPFAEDPERVVASGGVVRAVNGCSVTAGRVVDVRMPSGWLARIQIVEYLRAFLLGRTGWSKLRTLMLISGAFGLFRRDIVVEAGGLDADCIGEDMELVVRMHRIMRQRRQPYRIVFVAEPVSWTEVPWSRAVLARQRRRWSRGLAEVLWRHKGMVLNPRYGSIGLIGLPYYVLFELLAPFVELFGVVFVVAGLALGVVNLWFGALFLLAAFAYAFLLSLAALAVEEFSFHRYHRWRDLLIVAAAALVENLGYRQMTAVWRIQGIFAALARRPQVWGVMTRAGFGSPPTANRAAGPAGGTP